MILVLTGEGSSDIGTIKPLEAGWQFLPGPMAWTVDRLLENEEKLGYSVLELHADGGDCAYFLSESDLASLRRPRPLLLPRSEDSVGNQYFRKGAYLLGKYAQMIAVNKGGSVIAVFFRDSDGTRSSPKAEWRAKFNSIKSGFEAAEFGSGVPMVPRPKSEAWMLCGLLKIGNAGNGCNWLEGEPGNDASPNSLKSRLAQQLGYEPSAEQQAELVRSRTVDANLIDLPSFIAFREELDRAFANT